MVDNFKIISMHKMSTIESILMQSASIGLTRISQLQTYLLKQNWFPISESLADENSADQYFIKLNLAH